MLHQPKVAGKSNLRVLSLLGASYPGLLSAGPDLRTSRGSSPGEPGRAGGGTGAPDTLPPPSHLASSAPAECGRKDAAHLGARCRRPRTIRHPRTLPPTPRLAHLRALLSRPRSAEPRRGSHAPGARRATGPTEALLPLISRPRAGPRRGGGAGGGAQRREWRGWGGVGGGDALGARGGRGATPGRGPHPCARSCGDPRGSSPGESSPRLHSTASETLRTWP